jgi:phosphotransferase system HPr (HPr) family protein
MVDISNKTNLVKPGEEKLEQDVFEIEVEIKNDYGLHMRPAMKFVDIASQHECEITVSNDSLSVDGKSIMQMCQLVGPSGTKLKIRTQGEDAKDAIDALKHLIEVEKFDEPDSEEKK